MLDDNVKNSNENKFEIITENNAVGLELEAKNNGDNEYLHFENKNKTGYMPVKNKNKTVNLEKENEQSMLPHNISCEQELLSAILNDESIIPDVINEIDITDFYINAHRIIYSAVCTLFAEGKNLNLSQLVEVIGKDDLSKTGGISYITELIVNGSRIDLNQHIKILKEKSFRRKVINEFGTAIKEMFNDRSKCFDIVQKTINSVAYENKSESYIFDDNRLFAETLQEIDERVNLGGEIPGMKTGLHGFDRNVGGLQRGELDIIAGRPSIGKTLFALNLADGLGANGYKTLLCELEMTEKSIGMRRLAFNAHIEIEKMKFGKLDEEERKKIAVVSDMLCGRNNMFTDCTPGQSLYSIRAKAKSIKHIEGLDVIIIDHLNLMNIQRKETRDVAIGEVTRGLKILAKELDVCILLICQLSRAVEQRNDKRPMLSDLRESGNIEQDADMVMLLYRDEYYNRYTKEPGVMECIIGKHRNGRIGTLKFNYDEKYQKIGDL